MTFIVCNGETRETKQPTCRLKGLVGHAILGNFKLKQNKGKAKGLGWTKLERIEVDCIWVNLKNIGPLFFKFTSVYIKMSFKQLENHSQLVCGCDFENERLLLCQFDV